MNDILETTLCLLVKDEEILLARKKRGFGEGKYNGVGGKLEKGETPLEAMIRETKEEIGVIPTEYSKVGKVSFDEFYKDKKVKLVFHLYIATKWEGIPKETEEMIPEWFNVANILYDKMFPDDRYWLPLILEGQKIDAYFDFDEDWNLLAKDIKEFKEID